MKIRFLLLILLCIGRTAVFGVPPALAEDFLIGTVIAAKNEGLQIEMAPISGDIPTSLQQKSILVRLSPDSLVMNGRGERVFPGCVFPGGTIRVWGQWENGVFQATDIRGYRGCGRGDPTGVRRRLQHRGGRGCGPGGPGFFGGRP